MTGIHRALGIALVLCLPLTACYTLPPGVQFEQGVKDRLEVAGEAVLFIVDEGGQVTLVDREGRFAKKCAVPINVAREKGMLGEDYEKQKEHQDKEDVTYSRGHSGLPKCPGLDKGYLVEAVATKTLIIGGPNPHGCRRCYTDPGDSETGSSICFPIGCDGRGH